MKGIRMSASVAVMALLVVGYAASQIAYFEGRAPSYAKAVDDSPIRWLSLFLLVLCIVFAFIADSEAHEK